MHENSSPNAALLISLMSPAVAAPTGNRVGGARTTWAVDLRLEELARAFNNDPRYLPFIRQTLGAFNADPTVIAWRQAVLDDFARNPLLVEQIEALLPRLAELRIDHGVLGN